MNSLPPPVGGLRQSCGLSTTLPKDVLPIPALALQTSVSRTSQPIASGKILSKPRRDVSGKPSSDSSTTHVDSLGVLHSDVHDGFVIKLPKSKDEFYIPGKCVRNNAMALLEVTESYANLLNVSPEELKLVEMDLSAQFAEIRLEFSEVHFRQEVLASAAGFEFSEDVCSRDTLAYKQSGNSIASLVDGIQKSKAHDRFNQSRCDAIFRDDPEYERLSSLATDGVIIDKPEGLILQSVPEPPRKLQQQLDVAYRQHASKVWDKSNGVIIEQSVLSLEDQGQIHFNPAHLTRKPGGSRFCMDCTNSEGGNVLNTPDVKVKVLDRYGPIHHPTLSEMSTEWYEYADGLNVPLSDCRLFKDDFSGAFTQMNVNPNSALLLALAIGGGLILIYLTGLFGWLGFPMAYAVLSRAFERLFRRELQIPLRLYVDDIIALSLANRAEGDQLYIERKCEETMGSKAISYEKKVPPCLSCEVLGWLICLFTESFRPSDKGIRKLVFAFWLVATGDKFPLIVYQLLASLAQHYSLGLPGMAAFVYPLHNMVAQFHGNQYYKKKPSSAARLAIEVWKVVAILSLRKHPLMCRPLRSLTTSVTKSKRRTIGITDASPTGLGIALYDDNNQLLRYMSYQFPFHAVESKYQNAREYCGYMFCFFFLEWVLGVQQSPHEAMWINDNSAAIRWASENKCNSLSAQYAFMVVTWKQMTSTFEFSHVEHMRGLLMGNIDSLSRGKPHSFDTSKQYVMSSHQATQLDKLFLLLDPSQVNDVKDHHHVFNSVITIARALSS